MNPESFSSWWWLFPILIGSLIILAIAVLVFLLVPIQAYQRGHGWFSWLLLGIFTMNPMYPLLLVALLPNKARARRRKRFAAELDAKLANLPVMLVLEEPGRPIDRSLGDLLTAEPERSIGDMPTRAPFRSIGDLPTQD